MKVEPFAVEQWMDAYETSAKYNIAETCCDSISLTQLLELSSSSPASSKDASSFLDINRRQDYGHIRGSPELKENIAALYNTLGVLPLPVDNVLVTQGAIAANFLLLYTLVGPGDHVVCHHPTYQQLYSVPATLGAEVSLWKATSEARWALEIEELKRLLKSNTKLIIINNPNNPTGAVLKNSFLQELVSVASERGIFIMCDEVYRPLFHGLESEDPEFPPSILSLGYEKTIATGSLSKAYSLAGIRTGWLASRDRSIIERCAEARDYTAISVSQLDQQVATVALSPATASSLIRRNVTLARTNLILLEEFVQRHSVHCEWVKPVAGTTAFVKMLRNRHPVDASDFCKRLQEETGTMMLPGDFGFGKEFSGYVRIGYVPDTEVLRQGLAQVTAFMEARFDSIKLAPAEP